MLTEQRKQWLSDQFYLIDEVREHLTPEEQEYWDSLSVQWNQTLASLYGKISEQNQPLEAEN